MVMIVDGRGIDANWRIVVGVMRYQGVQVEFFGSLSWSCVGNEGCGRAWLKQANSLESAAIAMLLAEKFF